MLGITGIIAEKLAGYIGTLTTVHITFILAAKCHRALTVKRLTVSFYTSTAIKRLFIFAICAVKTTP
jgi:hypothetical protein